MRNKKGNKKHKVLPAKGIIGQIKNIEPSDMVQAPVTLEGIKDIMNEILDKAKADYPTAILGVGAIMNCDDEKFVALIHYPGIQVVGTKESIKTVMDRYNKLLRPDGLSGDKNV